MLTLNLFVWTALMLGQGTSGQACIISSCTAKKAAGKRIGTWSPRSDVEPPYGWKPILSYNVVNNYREFLTNEKQLAELRKRFEAYTGPVKNTGGVR